MTDEYFQKKCMPWKIWLGTKAEGDTDISRFAAAHLRFFDHALDLTLNTKDPVKKEKLMEEALGYIETFRQCGWDIRKAHEILTTKYISKQEETK